MAAQKQKARSWTAMMYPENMVDGWQDEIGHALQHPYAYCIHDKDTDNKGELRKEHVHIVVTFPNTTTYSAALALFKKLEKDGCSAIPNDAIEQVSNLRYMYDYLIHDTDDSRKKHKYQYAKNERVVGNGFDIGALEQVSTSDKRIRVQELAREVISNGFTNYTDVYLFLLENYSDDSLAMELAVTYSGFFERLTKGNYLRSVQQS